MNQVQQAIEALETAKTGLEWYRDRYPEAVGGSDGEADAQIDAAIAGLRELASQQANPWKVGPLTEELVLILGRPNFTCIRYAQWLRDLGQEIPRKAEHEQAAVIHWMLGFYATHGDKWAEAATENLKARHAALEATK